MQREACYLSGSPEEPTLSVRQITVNTVQDGEVGGVFYARCERKGINLSGEGRAH